MFVYGSKIVIMIRLLTKSNFLISHNLNENVVHQEVQILQILITVDWILLQLWFWHKNASSIDEI